jgi:RNA polymerase sigma factor (TIGR02999 family)
MSDVTQILSAIEQGDSHAAEKLLPLVYDELRNLAAHKLANEKPGQTLQPTALVHEAYLRLIGDGHAQHWSGRGHFFAAAAEAMRRILVESGRRKNTLKRGGERTRVELDEVAAPEGQIDELLAVSDALDDLEREEPAKAALVKLRYFTGLTLQEAADALGMSRATADRHWGYAKAWLYRRIAGAEGPGKE